MMSVKSAVFAAVALAAQASASDHVIKILAMADMEAAEPFMFSPNSVTAEMGDILEFHFGPANHSVAMGTFESPCSPMANGFFSGYFPVASGEADQVFQVEVTTTAPMIFYCTQGQHCSRGMYGVVNPTSEQGLETYKALITSNGPSTAPASVGGGEVKDNSGPATTTGSGAADATSTPGAAGSYKASMAGIAGALGLAMLMA